VVKTNRQNDKGIYPLALIQKKKHRRKISESSPVGSVRRQVCENTVIPAQAGIQTKDVNLVSLDPRLRGGDGKTELVDGLGGLLHFPKEVLYCVTQLEFRPVSPDKQLD